MIADLATMPNWNASTGARGTHSVSEGHVYRHPSWRVACKKHGAMNSVAEDRTIWRCIACGAGAYVAQPELWQYIPEVLALEREGDSND